MFTTYGRARSSWFKNQLQGELATGDGDQSSLRPAQAVLAGHRLGDRVQLAGQPEASPVESPALLARLCSLLKDRRCALRTTSSRNADHSGWC